MKPKQALKYVKSKIKKYNKISNNEALADVVRDQANKRSDLYVVLRNEIIMDIEIKKLNKQYGKKAVTK